MQYNWGKHTIKGGLEWQQNENFRNTTFQDSNTLFSLQPGLSGITADRSGDWVVQQP